MTLPTSLLAYQDCIELFDAALDDEFGCRFEMEDYDKALHYQARLHQCRKLHRLKNQEIYDEGDTLYGRSEYDCVVVRIKKVDDKFYLYLERNDRVRGEIEPLSALESEA